MKSRFLWGVVFIIVLSWAAILSSQENGSNDVDHANKEMKMVDRQNLERNKEAVRRIYTEVLNTGKLESLKQIFSEEYVGISGRKGPSAFAETVEELRQGFPDIKFTVQDLIAEGDKVAVRQEWKGTHRGLFRGFSPTQKQITNHGIAVFQFRDDKIIRSWVETDRLGFLQQIGAVSPELGSNPHKVK